MTDGRPYDFINIGFKAEALLAGYAVVSMDFRGTGERFLQTGTSVPEKAGMPEANGLIA